MLDFCAANNVSTSAFRNWLKRYDEGGLSALYRSKKTPSILPEGVDETEECSVIGYFFEKLCFMAKISIEKLPKALEIYIEKF